MPPKGSGRGRGRGRGKAQAPTRVATTRTTRASAASTTSAEVDDTVALNSATAQPTLAANSVTVSSKPKKGLKTKSADSHPSVALVPTEQGNQTNPKKPRAKKAADPEDLNQQPGDTKQQSAKLDGELSGTSGTSSTDCLQDESEQELRLRVKLLVRRRRKMVSKNTSRTFLRTHFRYKTTMLEKQRWHHRVQF